MVTFKAEIEHFGRKGEKTGWFYLTVPMAIANQIKEGCRKSYRVKGKLDAVEIEGRALTPMGEGNFILPLKKSLRQELGKEVGGIVQVTIEEDTGFTIELPEDLELCLADEPHQLSNFLKLPKSHQHWYINWLNTAKTEVTRTKRIVKIVSAMDRNLTFSEMMREDKAQK